jgi:hypothetical protein
MPPVSCGCDGAALLGPADSRVGKETNEPKSAFDIKDSDPASAGLRLLDGGGINHS